MFVCICNAIRSSDLREAARCSDGDADAVYRMLGRTPQCRQCIEDAQEIIGEERSSHCAVVAAALAERTPCPELHHSA